MTPTPPSTTSSSAGAQSPEDHFRVVKKRNRVPLSCAPCRQRKLKCNRSHPCENCVKRGDAASCSYAQPGSRKKNGLSHGSSNSPDDMQNRIDRLESLVLSLMTNGNQSAGPAAAVAALSNESATSGQSVQDVDVEVGDQAGDGQNDSDTESVTKSFGVMKVDNNKSYYISEAHWASVLSDIAEVRQHWANHKKQYEEQHEKLNAANAGLEPCSLLFGTVNPATRPEIMSAFPSRYTADMLIARYFEVYSLTIHIFHAPTFQKEYAEHWKDPSKSTLVWIAMVFALMRLAVLSYHRDGDEPLEIRGKCLDMARNFRNSMSQCLVLADYTKPHAYLIETLIYHLHAEYHYSKDTDVSVYILVGVVARLAMRMGFHRDSRPFLNITPFQGEMRRRTWAFIRHVDILFSCQVGLPSMVRLGDSDTELPRNIFDADIGENSKELPPPRPHNEPTPISWLIVRARLASALGRVIEYMSSVKTLPYETVMEIDGELRQARELIPEHMQIRPLEECKSEPPSVTLNRFAVQSIYHKGQCMLHRRFLTRSRDNPRFTHSRRTCIDSSMELLRFQSILHDESGPSGRLRSHRTPGAMNKADFLLAGTIVCLDLTHSAQLQERGQPTGDVYAWGKERGDEMMAAIRRAKAIWDEIRDESMEAYKASCLLGVMISKLSFNAESSAPPSTMVEMHDEQQNAAMTLGLLSTGLSPQNQVPTPFSESTFRNADPPVSLGQFASTGETLGASSPFGMFGQAPEMQSLNLDWDAWDNYIQNSTADDPNAVWPVFEMSQPAGVPSPLGQTPLPPDRTAQYEASRRIRLPGVFPSENGSEVPPLSAAYGYQNGPPRS